jgi:hypothetical protein
VAQCGIQQLLRVTHRQPPGRRFILERIALSLDDPAPGARFFRPGFPYWPHPLRSVAQHRSPSYGCDISKARELDRVQDVASPQTIAEAAVCSINWRSERMGIELGLRVPDRIMKALFRPTSPRVIFGVSFFWTDTLMGCRRRSPHLDSVMA